MPDTRNVIAVDTPSAPAQHAFEQSVPQTPFALAVAAAAEASLLYVQAEPAPALQASASALTPAQHKVMDTLKAITVDRMTPLDALNLLARLQRELE